MNHKNRPNLEAVPTAWKSQSWARAHADAVSCPRPGFESALYEMISGWLDYADAHAQAYESGIGDDGVLGEHWAQIGTSLRGLLNGCLGRFDGGLLDSLLARTLQDQKFDPETL